MNTITKKYDKIKKTNEINQNTINTNIMRYEEREDDKFSNNEESYNENEINEINDNNDNEGVNEIITHEEQDD